MSRPLTKQPKSRLQVFNLGNGKRDETAMDDTRITIVPMDDVDDIPLPNGSWSKMLLTGDTVSGIVSSLG